MDGSTRWHEVDSGCCSAMLVEAVAEQTILQYYHTVTAIIIIRTTSTSESGVKLVGVELRGWRAGLRV